jgi:hypothetical protein
MGIDEDTYDALRVAAAIDCEKNNQKTQKELRSLQDKLSAERNQLRMKDEIVRAKEETLQMREEIVRAKEESLQMKEESLHAKEKSLRDKEEALRFWEAAHQCLAPTLGAATGKHM